MTAGPTGRSAGNVHASRTEDPALSQTLRTRRPAKPAIEAEAPRPDGLVRLYARPGFKLRRAHQVALSVFVDCCADFDVTTTQYGILVALQERPGLDQIGLAQALGLDRSTTGMVVGLLAERGLLSRTQHATDRRRRVLALTPAGTQLLAAIGPAAEEARRLLLAPLSPAEVAALDALLDRLLAHHDGQIRVPLMRPGD